MAEKFKIAVLVDSYNRGGVALALQAFLLHLPKERYDITLFIRNRNGKSMLPVPEGVRCADWLPERAFSPGNKVRALLSWRNFGRKQVYETRCCGMLPGEYDCAIAYQMISNPVTVMTLEKVRAKRKILWLHGKKNFRDRDLAFYDDLYSKADKIVCVSLETEERFRGLMPKSAENTVTIHNLYDIPHISAQAEAPAEGMNGHPDAVTLVSVGRISKEKGFDRVPEVARRLKEQGYRVHWYIVGDGDRRTELERSLEEQGVADCVHLLGHRDNPYPYVANCDLYVQPSYTEGFCTSTMEAKILCKPVVTTDVPGMREQFVSGENGLIVESSPDGIYDGIRQMLDAPELRERIVNSLRAEPVSNDEVLRQTMAVIEGIPLEK